MRELLVVAKRSQVVDTVWNSYTHAKEMPVRKLALQSFLLWLLLPGIALPMEDKPELSRIVRAGNPQGELFIMIGKTKDFSPQPSICGADRNCLAFDSHYIGKFHVETVIAGDFQEKEIEVDFFYHSFTEPFHKADYALIFFRKIQGRLVEVKYRSRAIFKSDVDDWAVCLHSKPDDKTGYKPKPRMLLDWVDVFEGDPNEKPVHKIKHYRCKYSVSVQELADKIRRSIEIADKDDP